MTGEHLAAQLGTWTIVVSLVLPLWLVLRHNLRGVLISAAFAYALAIISAAVRYAIAPRQSLGGWLFLGWIAVFLCALVLYGIKLAVVRLIARYKGRHTIPQADTPSYR